MQPERRSIPRRSASGNFTASCVVFSGPVEVTDIILVGGTSVSRVALYDGVDITGERITKLVSMIEHSAVVSFRTPLKFRKGLYITIAGAGADTTICYRIPDGRIQSE